MLARMLLVLDHEFEAQAQAHDYDYGYFYGRMTRTSVDSTTEIGQWYSHEVKRPTL